MLNKNKQTKICEKEIKELSDRNWNPTWGDRGRASAAAKPMWMSSCVYLKGFLLKLSINEIKLIRSSPKFVPEERPIIVNKEVWRFRLGNVANWFHPSPVQGALLKLNSRIIARVDPLNSSHPSTHSRDQNCFIPSFYNVCIPPMKIARKSTTVWQRGYIGYFPS